MSDDEKSKTDASLPEEGGGGEGLDDHEGGGFNAKKLVLFVLLPLFILIGVGAGLYMTGMLDKFFAPAAEGEHAGEAHEESGGHGEEGHGGSGIAFLAMPDMIVNLATPEGASQKYLRLRVQLELKNEADKAAVEAVMPRVIDQFQTYLRELRVKDLRGSAGIYRLQTELLARVNAAAYPVEIKDVLFQEILIQ